MVQFSDHFHEAFSTNALLDTGWRRLIGFLKVQVVFCKRATNSRALLLKMTYEDKASDDSTPLCIQPTLLCVYGVNSFVPHLPELLTRNYNIQNLTRIEKCFHGLCSDIEDSQGLHF